MYLILPIYIALGTWLGWTFVSLWRGYQLARTTKLPILVSPTVSLNPFWIVTYRAFPPIITLLQWLPFQLGRWSRYTYMGWQWDDKTAIHDKLGPAFVVCGPGYNEIIVADAHAAHTVFANRKSFQKPALIYNGLAVFGQNVNSAEGERWQRHRRITAPNFNERVSSSVWTECIRQTHQMLQQWTSASSPFSSESSGTSIEGTRELFDDMGSLTTNVFTYAGFGIQYAFHEARSKVVAPHKLSYRDALYSVLRGFTILAVLPMKSLKWPIMPRSIREFGDACDEFKLYMKEMVDAEKQAVVHQAEGREKQNLLGALVQASQAEGKSGLSDEEIYGNLFVYNLAGHETTANTVATAIAYLASKPRWQAWIHEEIKAVCKGLDISRQSSENEPTWPYETVFPRLKRCQAVMFETLRLHGSIPFVPRITPADSAQVLIVNGVDHVIPSDTWVTVNSQALHCDTKTWGSDALEWRPDRWIVKDDKMGAIGEETVKDPAPGTFVGWAEGPRACPGKKFSQVEIVGVLAAMFNEHEVRPVKENGETDAQAHGRLQHMIDDSAITAITLQMRRPRDVALSWRKRT